VRLRHRLRILATALAALLAAGCLGPTPDGPDTLQAGTPWTAWTGPVAANVRLCGFCAGSVDGATGGANSWTGIDAEGRVLVVGWSLDRGGPGLRFGEPSLEGWRPVVEPSLGRLPRQQEGAGIVVFSVTALALAPRDAGGILAVMAGATQRLEPLGEPDYSDCQDCGASIVVVGDQEQEVGGNRRPGSGWVTLEHQLGRLHSWALGLPWYG
jgi:hypothetical protein